MVDLAVAACNPMDDHPAHRRRQAGWQPRCTRHPDTDGGMLDGDTTWDRAVGPFQFIPSTWARWKADGNADGVADPQNIDDAALAAGRYLCAAGTNFADGTGWWRTILSYDKSTVYVQNVFNGADSYARAALHCGRRPPPAATSDHTCQHPTRMSRMYRMGVQKPHGEQADAVAAAPKVAP